MLTNRSHTKEDLDNLNLNGKELIEVLEGLSRINRLLGNTNQTLKAVKEQFDKHKILSIVDLGCGGGDNLIAIAKWLSSKDKTVQLIGIDGNQNSLDYAASKSSFNIEFIQQDILDKNFELPECDLLISSHFMYHFKDDELISFLKKATTKVNVAMIFSELKRDKKAYSLFQSFGSFLGQQIKSDGLKAIERSFTIDEFFDILDAAEMLNIKIETKKWYRYMATIQFA